MHQQLDGQLFRRLLEMEQTERRDQLRASLQQQGVDVPGADAAAGDGSGGGGVSDGSSGVFKDGSSSAQDGFDSDSWQRLMSSAPFLSSSQPADEEQRQ